MNKPVFVRGHAPEAIGPLIQSEPVSAVRLPTDLTAEIDAWAKHHEISRSEAHPPIGRDRAQGEGEMKRHRHVFLVALTTVALCGTASAQTPKELKTKSGSPVVVVNFLNAPPDCRSNPGPIAVPVVREKPANGIIQMMILVADVTASGKCPARKIPTTALIYTPKKDFVGVDSVQIEIEAGNQTTSLSYKITVQAKAEQL